MLEVVKAPATEVLTLADAKSHLRVTGEMEDGDIRAKIVAATAELEDVLRVSLTPRTLRVSLLGWPDDPDDWAVPGDAVPAPDVRRTHACIDGRGDGSVVRLPRPPVTGVTMVEWWNPYDDSTSAIAATGYAVVSGELWRRGSSWPARPDDESLVRITYTAGYAAGEIPADVVQGLRERVTWLWIHREDQQVADTFRPRSVLTSLLARRGNRWSI